MRVLITGPNACGKSIFAENLIQENENILGYVGTLPVVPMYYEKIARHRSRRQKEWKLLEISGSMAEDINRLKLLFSYGYPILLDGLSVMLWRSCECSTNPSWHLDIERFSASFLRIISEAKSDWIIVDTDNAYKSTSDISEKYFNEIALNIHNNILLYNIDSYHIKYQSVINNI